MSRTYRRKNAGWQHTWELRDHIYKISKYGGRYSESSVITKDDPRYKKILNHFHSDKDHVFRYGVPSWVANLYSERSRRVTTRNKIVRWMRNQDEDIILDNFRHDIGYNWY